MRKHFHSLAVLIAILILPSLIIAGAHQFGAAKAISKGDNSIVIPLEITNEANLTALDIHLKYSEGLTLMEVDFENTRVSYFDLKVANIDNEENVVVIGLLPQMTPVHKPDLQAGSGVIANLVFEINDKSLEEVTLEAVTLEDPNHDLIFVYHDIDDQGNRSIRSVSRSDGEIDFESVTVALLGTGAIPESFDLHQNYPNPFNPSTQITYALPKATHVKLAIYNVLGQEVSVLHDDMMEAGTHVTTWDAGDRASGVYFYRITTDDFKQTKKMMLLK